MIEGLRDHIPQQSQAAGDENRERNIDQRIDLPSDTDLLHQALQQSGKHSRLQDEGKDSDNINVAGLVEVGDDGRNGSQKKRLHREDANARNDPALPNRSDLQYQDQCRHQRDDPVAQLRIGNKVHAQPQNRNVEMSASAPRMKATMSNSGTRNNRSLALVVSTRTMRHASTSSLAR